MFKIFPAVVVNHYRRPNLFYTQFNDLKEFKEILDHPQTVHVPRRYWNQIPIGTKYLVQIDGKMYRAQTTENMNGYIRDTRVYLYDLGREEMVSNLYSMPVKIHRQMIKLKQWTDYYFNERWYNSVMIDQKVPETCSPYSAVVASGESSSENVVSFFSFYIYFENVLFFH